MGIDTKTVPSTIIITLNTNSKYIKELKDQAVENDLNWGSKNKPVINMGLTNDKHTFETEEYYYDGERNEIHLAGTMKSSNGESSIYLDIPLSDIVLLDILQHAIKKLNKLKIAMETLK